MKNNNVLSEADCAELVAALAATRKYLDRRLPQMNHHPDTPDGHAEGYGDPLAVAAIRPIFEAITAGIARLRLAPQDGDSRLQAEG